MLVHRLLLMDKNTVLCALHLNKYFRFCKWLQREAAAGLSFVAGVIVRHCEGK